MRGGQVIGATDAYGETPKERPIRPEDIAHNMLHLLGIDPESYLQAPNGRPMQLVKDGGLIQELM